MRYNFSTDNEKAVQTFELLKDLARNDYERHIAGTNLTKADLEKELRERINKDMLGGRTLYQALRNQKNTIFEIVETLVNVAIGENVFNSPFVDEFVEIQNRALGDTGEFYSEGGLLSVATFAGNHWDTERQSIDIGDSFTLKGEWIYIHVYDELERFLVGAITLEKLMDKVYKSIAKYTNDRIYAQFQTVANSVPADFAVTGNDSIAFGTLRDKVVAAGGYSSITIAGTRAALKKLTGYTVTDGTIANSQREALASSGAIGTYDGDKLMVIPQTLASGTFNLALDDTKVFILGGDSKPIKLDFYGDSRTKEFDMTGRSNNDQTVDMQIQTKMGIGMVLPPYFGVYTFQ